MIICAGDNEQFSFATPIGIGMINSSIHLTKLCLFNPPEFILFVGTAGSYGNLKPFDIVESKSSSNIENSFFTHKSYTPLDNIISTANDISKDIIVNSSNYITTDEKISKYYLNQNIQLENMEFFAVLKVAEMLDIPAGGIFIITNYCNQNAHKDFLSNQKKAMNKLTDYMKNRV